MKRVSTIMILLTLSPLLFAAPENDSALIKEAARNYIVSQHTSQQQLMAKALHKKLTKRTFWQQQNGGEFIMETNYNNMLNVAKNYNKLGDKFPTSPRIDIKILDIEQRVASVKLTADDWIDYMHLVKTDEGDWKIINVLWQYHDITKHQAKGRK
ncbi:nuclear transport factor 2 family protein [Thalassotalea sp. ND16A]|uniref:nuclear transport factor 2 family protein n=1 Tax=Thalassotalea sp. ND16A TaxID=1535422 RepID=UPI00051A1E13|nr:nuclear transport factor 2 family protein [Thalassotalea sp. ND16A]KGK00335.1 hypothetical protein ND16A_3542 [Thalassotalea sp. ND16A]